MAKIKKEQVKELDKTKNADIIKKDTVTKEDYNKLLSDFKNLESLVRKTWDHNKIKEYEDTKKTMDKFSFSIKLYPTEEADYPIINWKLIRNYVANEGKDVDQRIKLVYLKDWKEVEQEIKLVDFVRILKRTEPILADKLENLDWTDVYVDKKINAEEDIMFYVLKPKDDIFKVNLNYQWQKLSILSTYLNA